MDVMEGASSKRKNLHAACFPYKNITLPITEQTSRVQAGEARALKSSAPPLKGGREYERATAEWRDCADL